MNYRVPKLHLVETSFSFKTITTYTNLKMYVNNNIKIHFSTTFYSRLGSYKHIEKTYEYIKFTSFIIRFMKSFLFSII